MQQNSFATSSTASLYFNVVDEHKIKLIIPMNRFWLHILLLYFFTVTCIGVVLRGIMAGYFNSLNYQFVLHSHSHTAFIGWVFQSLFFILVSLYLPKEINRKHRYSHLFVVFLLLSAMMTIAFWHQGYAPVSIALSSVFQLLSYVFVWQFWRDGQQFHTAQHRFSWKFAKIALACMVVSTFGPWALAIISAKGLQGTDLYSMAIYFYMHFQLNGWFIFGVLAGLLFVWEEKFGEIHSPKAEWGFVLLGIAVFPAYVLSIYHLVHETHIFAIGLASGLAQILGVLLLVHQLFHYTPEKIFSSFWPRLLGRLAIFALGLKFVLQTLSILPGLEELAFHNRGVVIAYVHLVTIGFTTFGIITVLAERGLMNLQSLLANLGAALLLLGFIVTEIVLIAPAIGFVVPQMVIVLYYAAIAMGVGIAAIWAGQR